MDALLLHAMGTKVPEFIWDVKETMGRGLLSTKMFKKKEGSNEEQGRSLDRELTSNE